MGTTWKGSPIVALSIAAVAGAIFVYPSGALLTALGWDAATFAEISLDAPGWRSDPTHGFAAPVIAAATCGSSLVGLVFVLAHFVIATPFLWLFPLFTCLFVRVFGSSRSSQVTLS
jgi:hypothetical protein